MSNRDTSTQSRGPNLRPRRVSAPQPIPGPSRRPIQNAPLLEAMQLGTPIPSPSAMQLGTPSSSPPRRKAEEDSSEEDSSESDIPSIYLFVNRIKPWHERFGERMHSMLSQCACDATELPVDEFPLVRTDRRIWRFFVFGLSRLKNLVAKNEYAASLTHAQSLLIRKVRCFLVSNTKVADLLKKNEDLVRPLVKKLGLCTKFVARKCPEGCKDKCIMCNVCQHMYECNCTLKQEGTNWCPHIHVMHEETAARYMIQGLMYFHDDWKYTELRHLRAIFQGPTKMKENKFRGCWEEQFDHMVRSQIYRVKKQPIDKNCECPPDKICEICEACLCSYSCTCEDYGIEKQVCQHIHNVAMQNRGPNSTDLFTDLNNVEFGKDYQHRPANERDDYANRRFYLEQEHEMSYYLDLDQVQKEEFTSEEPNLEETTLEKPTSKKATSKKATSKKPAAQRGGPVWKFPFLKESTEIIVKINPDKDEKCYCCKSIATRANKCKRCNICQEHYLCTCPMSEFIICRHMHAVVRYEEGVEEKLLERIYAILGTFQIENEITPMRLEGPIRVAVGLTSKLSAGTRQRISSV